jgi:SAM-dependent methyltransferase
MAAVASSGAGSFSDRLARVLRNPTAHRYTQKVVDEGGCAVALDIGCGSGSLLSVHRPRLRTIGVDVFEPVVAEAQTRGTHDEVLLADVMESDRETLLAPNGGRPVDLVTLYHVIEHIPKRRGYELLERCEELTRKFVVVATPNGFLPQGPEYGNESQRHLSGWFSHDFEGLGYDVFGSDGTKYLRGYAGMPRLRFRGWTATDVFLAWLLNTRRHPKHAFSLVAIKDVRGVPARLDPAAPETTSARGRGG